MNKHFAALAALRGTEEMVRIEHKLPSSKHSTGYPVGVSEKLLLLHVLEPDTFRLNGYLAVRLKDIISCNTDDTWVSRGARLIGCKPVVPDSVDMTDRPALVSSIQRTYPILMLETEEKEPDIAFAGEVIRQTKQYVTLKHINRQGLWTGEENFFFKDITRLIFGDGYVSVLTRFAEYAVSGAA